MFPGPSGSGVLVECSGLYGLPVSVSRSVFSLSSLLLVFESIARTAHPPRTATTAQFIFFDIIAGGNFLLLSPLALRHRMARASQRSLTVPGLLLYGADEVVERDNLFRSPSLIF